MSEFATNEERVSHLKLWETEFERKEMWKKKYDWRCPSCGGLLMNIGGKSYDGLDEFLMECLVCYETFVSGKYEIKKVSRDDIQYLEHLKHSEGLRDYLGFYTVETQIVEKIWNPNPWDISQAFVKLKYGVMGINTFEIAWCVFKQLAYRTGSISPLPPENIKYNIITKRAFDAIELNKTYVCEVHVKYTTSSCFGLFKSSIPDTHPYVSSIKGLILEENKKGIDRRVFQRIP